MPENKCGHPYRVEMSNGRATCPGRFEKQYRDVDNCQCCPHITQGIKVVASDFLSDVERNSRDIGNEIYRKRVRPKLRRRHEFLLEK